MNIRVIESTTYYHKLNKILEAVNISLMEMLELAEPIQKAIEDSNLDVPIYFKNIKSVSIFNPYNSDNIMVSLDDNKEMKIGRFLTKLFPDIKADEINRIVSRIKLNLIQANNEIDNYKFKLYKNNIGDWYKKCLASSCMTKEETSHLPFVYDDFNKDSIHHVSILILYNNDVIYGRALVWYNIDGANNGIFMDRIYPSDDKYSYIHEMFYDYARHKDWSYRKNNRVNGHEYIHNSDDQKLKLDLSNVWDNLEVIPYMDTFRYGNDIGILSNFNYHWGNMDFARISGTSIMRFEHFFDYANSNNAIPYFVFNYFFDLEDDITYKGDNIISLIFNDENINDFRQLNNNFPNITTFIEQYFNINDNYIDVLLFDKDIVISVFKNLTKDYKYFFQDTIRDHIEKIKRGLSFGLSSYGIMKTIAKPILDKHLITFIKENRLRFINTLNKFSKTNFELLYLKDDKNRISININILNMMDEDMDYRGEIINIPMLDNYLTKVLQNNINSSLKDSLLSFDDYIKNNQNIQNDIINICDKYTKKLTKDI